MNAKRARELTNNFNKNIDITGILQVVEMAAQKGESCAKFDINGKSHIELTAIQGKLKELGFEVSTEYGDQRDPYSILKICW